MELTATCEFCSASLVLHENEDWQVKWFEHLSRCPGCDQDKQRIAFKKYSAHLHKERVYDDDHRQLYFAFNRLKQLTRDQLAKHRTCDGCNQSGVDCDGSCDHFDKTRRRDHDSI